MAALVLRQNLDANPSACYRKAVLTPQKHLMIKKISSFFVAITTLPGSAIVLAEQAVEKKLYTGVSSGDLITVLLGLGLVLGLIFGCSWFVKRMGGLPSAGGGAIKIVSVLSVGTRERIALVEVGGKQLLLGVTAQQITTLHTFDEPVVKADDLKNNSEFAQKLHQMMSRGSKN
jgi:flagellar protein FliO/FliZ